MKLAVFIERDGVLNRVRVQGRHQVGPVGMEEFVINQSAAPLLSQLREAGFRLIVTTNQPGLSRGYQSRRELDRMHDMLRRTLPLDDIFVCPHDEMDECPCRKPRPGLLIEAGYKWHLNLEQSFVLSDKWQDAEAGRSAGCTSLLLDSPWLGHGHPDFVMPDLESAVAKILFLNAFNPALAV
jgi:D-glycero-D-manno-heptose 1,7-bisphosphate phosphatase